MASKTRQAKTGSRKLATGSKKLPPGSKKTAAKPMRVQQAGTAAERKQAALDYAAKRVPAWQVSVVGMLQRADGWVAGGPVGDPEPRQRRERIRVALAQVPPEVLRAVELHKAKAKAGANDGT